MSKQLTTDAKPLITQLRPALNLEDREQQLGNLAMNLAEKQLMEGTASSQVITYFLKATSSTEKLEKEKLIEENKKLRAQTEALESAKRMEELYADAMKVFKGYQGISEEDEFI